MRSRRRRRAGAFVTSVALLVSATGHASATTPPPAARSTAAPPQEVHFPVEEYRVSGNTVLPTRTIEQAVMPFLGPNRTREDVDRARAALEDAYGKAGFATVSVEIPPQDARTGIVRFKVVERRVGRLRVVGAQYFSPDAIKRDAPSLAEGRVPNLDQVQKEIVGLNQLPDRTVTPVLKPGRLPNTVDVDLQVADHLPLHGSIELNNRQQVDTKPLRAQASLSYNNLWQRGDSANVSFQLAPQRPQQSEILSASYLFHIPDSSLALLASYAHNDSNVKALSTTAALGRGDIVGLRLQVPLWFEPGFTQTLTAGLDYKNEKSTVNVAGTGSSAPISYYPFTIGYEAVWYSDTQSTDFNAQFVFGTLGLGNGNELVNFVQPPQPQTRFDYNRAYATPSFSYLRLLLTHTHELPYGMQAYVRAYAQITNDPLVPFEQLGLGGLDTVRGYYEQEALVDSGGGIQTELRSPSFADRLGTDAVNEARVHLFADTAAGTNHLSLPGTTSHVVLGSVGVGARVRVFDVMNAEVQNAIALSDGPNTKSGADSVLFRLFGEF